MQIEERTVGTVTILDLKGKLILGDGDAQLKDKVHSLVSQGIKQVLLNLGEVPYIDSAGIGEIVRTHTTMSRGGGSLKLLNVTKRIHDLLVITKLVTIFETFDSEAEALRSFLRDGLTWRSSARRDWKLPTRNAVASCVSTSPPSRSGAAATAT